VQPIFREYGCQANKVGRSRIGSFTDGVLVTDLLEQILMPLDQGLARFCSLQELGNLPAVCVIGSELNPIWIAQGQHGSPRLVDYSDHQPTFHSLRVQRVLPLGCNAVTQGYAIGHPLLSLAIYRTAKSHLVDLDYHITLTGYCWNRGSLLRRIASSAFAWAINKRSNGSL
jgi:hypothetical protein